MLQERFTRHKKSELGNISKEKGLRAIDKIPKPT
jgi:hypothetical protein